MDLDIAAGQLWVNAKIRELAAGKEPCVQVFEREDPAKRSAKDFTEGTIGLAIWMGEERRVIRFQETELKDVASDAEVQSKVLDQLRKVLQ